MRSDPLLARDPLAHVETHRLDNRFIPLQPADLVEALADESERFGATPEQIRQVAAAIDRIVAQEALAFERQIEALYVNYSPDRETVPTTCSLAARHEPAYQDLYRRLDYLLEKANYSRLDDLRLKEVVRAANTAGMRVRIRPELIEHLALYVRGRGTLKRCTRDWRHPLRGETREMPVYQRLVVVARLKGQPHVILKLFREIPVQDVEALLPHAEVDMTYLDRAKVVLSGAGLVGSMVLKGLKLLAFLALWSKLLWLVPIACLVLAGRSFIGYRTARSVRDSRRTQHLYYQNVANNKAVLHTLISMIRQEEIKEAILGWAMCRDPRLQGDTEGLGFDGVLKRNAEDWLRRRFQIDVAFDVADALETLERLRLVSDRTTYAVLDAAATLAQLDGHRREQRSIGYHDEVLSSRLRLAD